MGIGRHAEVVEAKDRPRLVEDSHDALLAPDGGGRGHPDVDLFAVDVGRQLTVLRTAPLDDVHARHDLDATHQPEAHGGGEHEDLLQCPVDPEADPDDVLGRLDVHIGGAVAHGLGEDAVDDLDHRSVVGDDTGRGGFDDALPRSLHDLERLHELCDAADGQVVAVDGPDDVARRGEQESNRVAALLGEEEAQRVARLGHGDMKPVIVQADRHGHVLPCHVFCDEAECSGSGLYRRRSATGMPKNSASAPTRSRSSRTPI